MSLTPSQRDALDQLHAITASDTDASRERDERLLRENGWDVQVTVEQIFSLGTANAGGTSYGGSSSRSGLNGPAREEPRATNGPRRPSGSGRRRPEPLPQNNGGLSVLDLVMSPFRLALGVVSGVWYLLIRNLMPISFLRYLPPFLRPPSISQRRPQTSLQDPRTTSLAYIRDLELLTGLSASSGSLPELYIGPYREFLNTLRTDGKVGMIVLTCVEHEDDAVFKRECLGDRELVRFLKEKEVVVWAGDILSREGYQVAGTLLATTYPSIFFISLLPGHAGASPKLSIISTLSGSPSTSTSSSSIIQTLTTSVLPRTQAFLARMKRERSTLEEARHLREEQDRAFARAEERDRARMREQREREESEKREKREAEDRANRQQKEREELEMKKRKEIENRREWRRYARKHLLPPPPTSSAGSIRVALRTPLNANRNIRLFAPTTSTEELYIYAETLLIPDSYSPSSDPDHPPLDYTPSRDFIIVTSYPRKEVDRVEGGGEEVWEMIKKAGGALFAEKIEGSVWGDAERGGEDSDEEE